MLEGDLNPCLRFRIVLLSIACQSNSAACGLRTLAMLGFACDTLSAHPLDSLVAY